MPFHVISVLSRDSLAMPDELLDFYLSEGIDQVCFNVEESEGDHVSDLFEGARTGALRRYAAFLRRFWHRARASGRVKFVREIDLALPRVFRPDGVPTRNIQTEPLAMLNVDSHGNVSSFSPELLGLKNKDYGDFLLGNINRQSLAEIHRACLASAFHRDIQAGVAGVRGGAANISRSAAAARRATSCSRTARSPARRRRTARSPRWCRPTSSSRPTSASSKAGPSNDPAPIVQLKSPTTAEAAALSNEDAMTRSKLFALASLLAATMLSAPALRSGQQPPPAHGRPRPPPRRPRPASCRLLDSRRKPGNSRARSSKLARPPRDGTEGDRGPAVAGHGGDQRRGAALAREPAAWTSFARAAW